MPWRQFFSHERFEFGQQSRCLTRIMLGRSNARPFEKRLTDHELVLDLFGLRIGALPVICCLVQANQLAQEFGIVIQDHRGNGFGMKLGIS